MFCDELKLKLVAGKGGDGCVSFRREKFVPKGGPNGGDGGFGGDVIIKVNPHLNTLSNLANKKTYKAQNGVPGKGKNMHGKNADNLYLEVPLGTIIYNQDKSELLADLNKANKEYVVTKGGKGGMGNARFVSSTHQAPRFAEKGEPGEEKEVILELKMVADIGLIGLPSAGKSTLISVISNAKPKIAAYHFTTLVPNLGVVNMQDFGGSKEQSFVVADIPGLIEGASEGKGLGHQFLKHISRTKVLIHVIDASLEGTKENFQTINKELKKFSPELMERPQIIAINKSDLLSEEELQSKVKELKKITKKQEIFTISAIQKLGLKELLFAALKQVEKIKEEELEDQDTIVEIDEEAIPVLQPHLEQNQFTLEQISKEDGHKIFHISGKRIEQLVIMTDTRNPEGLERIYHFFNRMGIQRSIEKEGATFGDKIKILDRVIPYRK